MITLYNKYTGRKENIYTILDDNHGYPKFLNRKDGKWIYTSAKNYITENERRKIAFTSLEENELEQFGIIKYI
jgi:hypothetical protein